MKLLRDKETNALCRITTILSLMLLCFLTSCASQSVKSSWMNQEFGEVVLDNVLVVAVTDDLTTRRIFEDSFVAGYAKAGVKATPSHSIKPEEIKATREAILSVVAEAKAKYVVLVYYGGSSEKTLKQQAVGGDYSASYESLDVAFFNANAVMSTVTRVKLFLETNIYEVESEKLIWSAVTQSDDPVMTRDYMDKVTSILIRKFQTDNQK